MQLQPEHILIALAIAFMLWLVFPRRRSRHERNIAKADRVLALLSSGTMYRGQAMTYLRKMDPYVFEEAVLTAFRRKGFSITRNRRYSGDGGVDGRVAIDGKEYPVQCKRYKSHIDRRHVEDFSRLCLREGNDGYFVHTGKTGKGSRERAEVFGNVMFVSGDKLLTLMGYKERKN